MIEKTEEFLKGMPYCHDTAASLKLELSAGNPEWKRYLADIEVLLVSEIHG